MYDELTPEIADVFRAAFAFAFARNRRGEALPSEIGLIAHKALWVARDAARSAMEIRDDPSEWAETDEEMALIKAAFGLDSKALAKLTEATQ